MHGITINDKEAMNLKENKRGIWEGWETRKGNGKGCKYTITYQKIESWVWPHKNVILVFGKLRRASGEILDRKAHQNG